MFSISFQLAGSILLTWTFLTISPREIIKSSHIVIGLGYKGIPENKKREIKKKLFEKYLSVVGITYISLGYLIQLLKGDNFINNWIYELNPINKTVNFNEVTAASLNTLCLIIIALIIAVIIRDLIFKKEEKKEEHQPEHGEMRLDLDE
ncbi:hypothetical protein ACERII_18425 [Evansella sp. AB-rgal1]|uniref:hypothetical protein n=1 Tax=Evansella sp. AB-rgal1 TaxID=3242696 RepID=UPI00359D8694